LHPEYGKLEAWPFIDLSSVPRAKRKGFFTNNRIVASVLSGNRLKDVARTMGVSASYVTQLLNRCFTQRDGQYALSFALIPYARVKANQRQAPLPSFDAPLGGQSALSGLWEALPILKDRLDHTLKQRIKDDPNAGPISAQRFHNLFKLTLKELNWPQDCYPYTSEDCAYESLRRYRLKRESEIKWSLSHAKTAGHSLLLARAWHDTRVLERIQIDSQEVDFKGRLDILLNDKLIPLRLAAAHLYIAIDVATDCILGYVLVYAKQPNRWDVRRLLAHCERPWQPLELKTLGFNYSPGASFPSGLPERPSINFNTVQFDNAWVHHSQTIRQALALEKGATLSFGHPKQPKTRNWVEKIFDYLNRHLSHQLPSTRGSAITDPKRESRKNQKKPPRFTWRMFEEAVSIVLAEHNIREQSARLGGGTPLDVFRYQMHHHWTPYTPSIRRNSDTYFEVSEVVPVKARTDAMARHINLDTVHYSCAPLTGLSLSDKRVRICYDWRDVRTLKVFTLQGRFLGKISAPRSWQGYPHSMATRKYLLKLIKTERMHSHSPIVDGLQRIAEKKDNPLYAMDLLRICSEINPDAVMQPLPSRRSEQKRHPVSSPTLTWSSQEAYHGR
jgi:hypothetical protein